MLGGEFFPFLLISAGRQAESTAVEASSMAAHCEVGIGLGQCVVGPMLTIIVLILVFSCFVACNK